MTILACFILFLIPYAASISFNLPNIGPNNRDMFRLEDGAYVSNDGIEVTPENNKGTVTGRVTYPERLHLWDNGTGELASFSTNFSFVKSFDLDDLHRDDDGLIFFLAQNSSLTLGGNDSTIPFVWVEFDPYCNNWERNSKCDHVGIHVNTFDSDIHEPWLNDMSSERECQVSIKYDSVSKNLSVDENNGKLRLVVGLTAGILGLIAFLVIIAYFLWRKRKNNGDKAEELGFSVDMNHEFEMGTAGPRRFSYIELAQATTGFTEKYKLGEGSFGGVYKGYKIAVGLASAVLYLHEGWEQCVLHRDIKSSNVMLDSSFNAKLGDFGLAKLVDHEKGSETTLLAGTLGYMAHECVVTGKASKETDVFSFGVVALEIACGRKAIDNKGLGEQIWIVEWVWEQYGAATILEAVDPRLQLDFNEDEVKRLMMVGLWCVHPDSKLRPSMRQVIQVLNSEASLPILPSKMPVASYVTTLMPLLSGGSNSDFSTSSSYLYGR
ncbi:hypothetical protein E3N88_27768 [Mikania micrantha]|uniref:Protein kinase domain-containing protein n=1 Tax=Mikania micrantha TaxID=192012 RepID=A0A5N6MYQ3_9ASTR|nr:hypothetical protein E3N88_27768 [Mikania micrantha]